MVRQQEENARREDVDTVIQTPDSAWLFPHQILYKMDYKTKVIRKDGTVEYNVLVEKYLPDGEEEWNSLFSNASKQRLLEAETLHCVIQGVIEPNKVRVISKGPGHHYYLARTLQKALASALRDIPCFVLTGRTLSPTDLIDLSASRQPGDEWFSIDYSAATDGLSTSLSREIFETLLSPILTTEELRRAWLVLGPHQFSYPCGEALDGPYLQRNGQLMGSPLSFPFLCLANLCLYLNVTEKYHTGRRG
jgi:hypothetical protein